MQCIYQDKLAVILPQSVGPTQDTTVSRKIFGMSSFNSSLVYTEFGTTDTDTLTLTITYGDTTTGKNFNILLRQIECTAAWK